MMKMKPRMRRRLLLCRLGEEKIWGCTDGLYSAENHADALLIILVVVTSYGYTCSNMVHPLFFLV